MSEPDSTSVFRIGENCWRCEQANRLAVIVDGEHYFRAVREAILAARHTVFILGWDIHSRLRLVRDAGDDGRPQRLSELLDHVAREHGVDVYVLSWDFAMIYWLERESLPLLRLEWKTHDRVRFHLDDTHPVGASQHQKLVVVDDEVAFCGGFDLSKWRWDSRGHRPRDARRVDPDGKAYPPFHDVQMAVAGPAAAALARLCRERWQRATGEMPERADAARDGSAWPRSVTPLLHDVQVAIARTQPRYADAGAVHEVERLYLDSIRMARRWIYIENQYLTAHRIGEALAERLAEPEGPEIVIVLPQQTGGWLEQHTMDVLRARLVKTLRAADRHDRLRIYFPRLSSNEDGVSLMVHAKLMVVDDCLLRVGSANLSNRSMGLDSECDLAVEAVSNNDAAAAIARVRNELLAEHLSVEPGAVAQAIEQHCSMVRAIDGLAQEGRALCRLETDVPPEIDRLVPEAALVDPERPVRPEQFVSQFVPLEPEPGLAGRAVAAGLLLLLFVGLAAAWRWTSLGDWLEIQTLTEQARLLKHQPAAPVFATLGIALAGCLAVPMMLLVVASVLTFGALPGFFYALAGAEISALLIYGAGQVAGRDLVRRYAGQTLNRISNALARRGILTVIALRLVPVAPFVIVNAVAGASRIRFRDFALGTLVGLIPGMAAISLFAEGLVKTLREPDGGRVAALLTAIVIIIAAMVLLRRWLGRARSRRGGE